MYVLRFAFLFYFISPGTVYGRHPHAPSVWVLVLVVLVLTAEPTIGGFFLDLQRRVCRPIRTSGRPIRVAVGWHV